jgi:hypothetical protein
VFRGAGRNPNSRPATFDAKWQVARRGMRKLKIAGASRFEKPVCDRRLRVRNDLSRAKGALARQHSYSSWPRHSPALNSSNTHPNSLAAFTRDSPECRLALQFAPGNAVRYYGTYTARQTQGDIERQSAATAAPGATDEKISRDTVPVGSTPVPCANANTRHV